MTSKKKSAAATVMSSSTGGPAQSLPQTAAIQLIRMTNGGGGGGERVELCAEGIEFLQKGVRRGMPVAIHVIGGMYRMGKSLFNNRVMLQNTRGGGPFVVGESIQACTMGLWVAPQTIVQRDPDTGQEYQVLIVDMEGLSAINATEQHDTYLLAIGMLMASCFTLNIEKSISESTLLQIAKVVDVAKCIRATSSSSSTAVDAADVDPSTGDGGKTFTVADTSSSSSSSSTTEAAAAAAAAPLLLQACMPNLMILIRDFSLDLRDERGHQLTTDEYLERALQHDSGSTADTAKNAMRRMLRNLFVRRACTTLAHPGVEQRLVQQLNQVDNQQLPKSFVEDMLKVRQRILQQTPIKRDMHGQPISGPMLVPFLQCIVDAFNGGQAPVIENAWSMASRIRLQQVYDACIAKWLSEIDGPSSASARTSMTASAAAHTMTVVAAIAPHNHGQKIMRQCMRFFDDTATGGNNNNNNNNNNSDTTNADPVYLEFRQRLLRGFHIELQKWQKKRQADIVRAVELLCRNAMAALAAAETTEIDASAAATASLTPGNDFINIIQLFSRHMGALFNNAIAFAAELAAPTTSSAAATPATTMDVSSSDDSGGGGCIIDDTAAAAADAADDDADGGSYGGDRHLILATLLQCQQQQVWPLLSARMARVTVCPPAELLELRDSLAGMQRRAESAEQQLMSAESTTSQRIADVEKVRAELEWKLEKAADVAAEQEIAAQCMREELQSSEQKRRQLEQESQQAYDLQQRLDESENELQLLQHQSRSAAVLAEQRIREIECASDAITKKASEAAESSSQLMRTQSQKMQELQQSLAKQQQHAKDLQQQHAKHDKEQQLALDDRQRRLDKLQMQLEDQQRQLADEQRRGQQLRTLMQEERQRADDQKQQLKSCESEQLRIQQQQMKERIDQARELETLRSQLAVFHTQLQERKRQREHDASAEEMDRRKRMRSELDQRTDQVGKLQAQIDAKTKAMDRQTAELTRLRTEMNELQNRHSDERHRWRMELMGQKGAVAAAATPHTITSQQQQHQQQQQPMIVSSAMGASIASTPPSPPTN
jgi:hypothetical protein